MVKVTLENLTKKFRDVVAVNEVNLEIEDEEFFVLLGPSGCGKTTTLNMVAGLEEPTGGSVYFDGKRVNELPPEKRDVAMVFQSYALYPTMTAYKNIIFPLKLKKLPQSEIDKRVADVSEMLRIEPLLKKKPHEMSGGERQRIALARAIVRNPQVFLLDEPLSNIDAKLRVRARAELIRLQKDLKVTTIYVTHDQVEAMTMASRIAVMDSGRLLQVARPLDIFRKPANMFVAGFIGTPPMNFFATDLVTKDGRSFLQSEHFSIPIDSKLSEGIKAKTSELMLGVRPDDLTIFKEEKRSPGCFRAEVYAVEQLGRQTILDLSIGNDIYKGIVPPDFECAIGDNVSVEIDASKIHLFNRKTEEAVP